ncbi:hypothetical protein [Sphingomonas sp.]|jgi:hypothetical protein|uniref:hypothetical protein n=1 Tax=Sphingomonas sp. TaxID=28214 RepID=UPI00356B5865
MTPDTAKRILVEPGFPELFDAIRADMLSEFFHIKPDDTPAMQLLRLKLDCLQAVRAKLENLAYDFDQSVRATKTTP